MLAQRFLGLLPPLSESQALESAAVRSLNGQFDPNEWGTRVLRAPHHTASSVALVGGGSPPRPGEISLAHEGVLFLDELAEFPRAALEALREPLETGRIVISRAARQAEFPARFQLVAAMNPCACGNHGNPMRSCRCSPDMVNRYQGRISGPLIDRVDLQIEVPAVAPETLAAAPDGESTSVVAERVRRAQQTQLDRQGMLNASLHDDGIDAHCALDASASKFLQAAAAKLGWSGRTFHRVLRVSRSIADLLGEREITVSHIAEAIQYRRVLMGV
jgi:magnesium chelatase family protein